MKSDQHAMPEWVPEGSAGDPRFACRVMPGVGGDAEFSKKKPAKRKRLSIGELEAGILAGDVSLLARAITLVESNLPQHEADAQELLGRVLPRSGNSMRVGITGVPGAGKSTLIESLGRQLCAAGHKLAVLAVDPSSSVTGGSILGDKTRMQELVREPNAFIRPSPSAGSLGGVGRKSRETMLLCEAAGFDVILVETVGVGQNEVTVRSMVDFFLLIQLAGAGDELQGMKKGVIEIADLIAVNKADGDNVQRAKLAAAEFSRVLQFLQPATEGWKTQATTCSAFDAASLQALWGKVEGFFAQARESGVLAKRRREQTKEWMRAMVDEALLARFYRNPQVAEVMPQVVEQVMAQELPVAMAVGKMMEIFEQSARVGESTPN